MRSTLLNGIIYHSSVVLKTDNSSAYLKYVAAILALFYVRFVSLTVLNINILGLALV